MASFVKYNPFAQSLVSGSAIDFTTDVVKLALVTATYTPSAEHSVWADASANEVAGAGYSAGGATVANVAVTRSGAVSTVDGDDVVFADTASGFTNARYAIVYSGTTLIGYADLGSDKTNDGTTLTLQVSASGLFTVQ